MSLNISLKVGGTLRNLAQAMPSSTFLRSSIWCYPFASLRRLALQRLGPGIQQA